MNPTTPPEPQETPQIPAEPATPITPPEPQPVVEASAPVATPVGPTPPQGPKKGLSKGALIAIIVGSAVVFLTLLGILTAVAITAYNNISDKATTGNGTSTSSSDAPKVSSNTTSYENGVFSFNYPSDWKVKDTSNQTTITDGAKVDTYTVITSPDSDVSGIVNYTYTKGGTQIVDKDRARAIMKTALQSQLNATPSQLLSYRESSGHGCAANVKYTTQPTLQEKGNLIGYTYGYTCESMYGSVQGTYGVWYDQYGGQQRLLVSALAPYWNKNSSALQAILDSAAAK